MRNLLDHETETGRYDFLLCDFGTSFCEVLGLDGGGLPDNLIYDPFLLRRGIGARPRSWRRHI